MALSKSAWVCSTRVSPDAEVWALLISTFSLPKCSTPFSMAALTWSSLEPSATQITTSVPKSFSSSAFVFSMPPGKMSVRIMLAPSSAKALATPLAIPPPPPVSSTTRSSILLKCCIIISSFYMIRGRPGQIAGYTLKHCS